MLSVQHNIQAMVTSNLLNRTNTVIRKNTEKLSSGYRVNRSADDAAGLAISEKMRRQIRGLTQASSNAQDGISMVQIADGAMSEIQDMLHRMNELSVKSANETLTRDDRDYIQAEIGELVDEIGAVSYKTTFNEIPLLLGPALTVDPGVADPGVADPEVVYQGSLPSWVSYTGDGYMNDTYTTDEAYTNSGGPGVMPISHEAAYMDFGSFTGTAGQVEDLIGNGFYTTCCTCSNHYSVEFTEGTSFEKTSSGSHYIYKVGIEGAASGEELVDRILAATGSNPLGHFTMLEKNSANSNELLIYDGRSNETNDFSALPADTIFNNFLAGGGGQGSGVADPDHGYGKFGPGVAHDITEPPITEPPGGNVKRLLVGSEATEANILTIVLPNMRIENLGISDIDISTVHGAIGAIESLKNAGQIVSTERSRMGTYQNRLEHTIRNLANQVNEGVLSLLG